VPHAGQIIRATDFTHAPFDEQNTSGTTTSTGYTPTLTGGVGCGVVFQAPTSGRVEVAYACQLANSGANGTFMSMEVKQGGVIGARTVVLAVADAHAVTNFDTAGDRAEVSKIVEGLTPGGTYNNARQVFKVVAGTGTFLWKTLSVKGLP
jgi:hypothetical protein